METVSSRGRDSPEKLPSLIKYIAANEVAGFDSIRLQNDLNGQQPANGFNNPSTPGINEAATADSRSGDLSQVQRGKSVSISMPPSPVGSHLHSPKRVLFNDAMNTQTIIANDAPHTAAAQPRQPKKTKFHSQPLPTDAFPEAATNGEFSIPPRNPAIDRFRDKRYDSFKTWSGKLERQISNLRGKNRETAHEEPNPQQNNNNKEVDALPVDRYFDALEGPELDTLRPSEEILLPEDKKWPFLLRYPISSFGMCLGVSSQAIMWKALATSESTKFLHISLDINLVLWWISLALVVTIASVYFLKLIFYFEAVRREFYHPIRVNFFFAPWIALLFLVIGVPPSISEKPHAAVWYILMAPIFCLELKIYGQWMSGGQRRLSKVANPSNHLSIVGNFVGALLGASMGLKEGPIFFFAVGLAHYTVLFVTLYQRLPTNETLPKELHPVFFLFVAAPSVASMAWAKIQGSFDYGSRVAYFIAMFLYFSLAIRVNFFRGFRFSLAWWAYTFPMTGAAIATVRYSTVVPNVVTKCITVVLCLVATLVVTALLVTTIIHAFVLGDLFPNDIAIAISDRKPKSTTRRWYHKRNGSSDTTRDIDHYLKYASSNDNDLEASIPHPSPTSDPDPSLSNGHQKRKEVPLSLF